jgi:probable HAF family extracellular repeat protein
MKAICYLLVLLAIPLSGCATPLRYAVTPVAGPGSVALGINNHGHTVGYLAVGANRHAFVNTGGGAVDLGTLGGADSAAYGINNAGVVVGEAATATVARRAFVYRGTSLMDLGTLGGTESWARAINNAGQITGTAALPDNSPRAFRYSGGVMQNLGTLPSTIELYSFGEAINERARVAGSSSAGAFTPPEPPQHAFVTRDGGLIDIGTFGGARSEAFGINDSGKVVGTSATEEFRFSHAFLWWKGITIDIGALDRGSAAAYDINNRDQVVGTTTAVSPMDKAFLWQRGKMVALDSLINPASGWHIVDARAINERQQIAGTGCRAGVCQAVRLDPIH